MQIVLNRLYGGVQTRFSINQSIARLTIEGVFSSAVSAQVLSGCDDDLRAAPAGALIADHSQSRMELSAMGLLARAQTVLDSGLRLRIPVAFVIRPDEAEMWRTYCLLMGRRGSLRQAFTDRAQAGQWAAEMAAIYESEARRRERGQSR